MRLAAAVDSDFGRVNPLRQQQFLSPQGGRLSGRGKSVLVTLLALPLLFSASLAHARSKPDPDKHAQKVAKKLAHFKAGALVHLVFVNATESTGTLDTLGAVNFTLLNIETNAAETHSYTEVEAISKGSNAIGRSARFRVRGR
jgi:hypothetical protein